MKEENNTSCSVNGELNNLAIFIHLILGTFPSWLSGSMVQTGPGLLDLPEFTMNNYLDGFAILSKLEINGGKVKLAKKYPQTESYQKAIELGKPYFMEYGTTAKREGSKTGGFLSKLVTTFVSKKCVCQTSK